MKTVKYKEHNLAMTSQAYMLYMAYKKSGDKKDQQTLDKHLKEVDQKYKALHYEN